MARKTNYKSYITGLKGFACVMVMIGHFLGAFAYADNMPIDIHYFLAVRNSKIGLNYSRHRLVIASTQGKH